MTQVALNESTSQNLLLDLFIEKNILLTKSFIVHNEQEALAYNTYITDIVGLPVDIYRKDTWRYYKHLAGEYFLLNEVDAPVTIFSLDTFETIELTKETIRLHRETQKELLKFGSTYELLVSKYRDQELYIKSLITEVPFTLQELIDKPNLVLLSWNKELIEEQEHSLIEELQECINNYQVTWMLPYYSTSNSLFLASQISIFYTFLLKKLIALRLKNAKTNQAHSFHIKQYLASHHQLEHVYPNLTHSQRLFLYRNLLYLNIHSGKNKILHELTRFLFTEKNIALVRYTFFQNETHNDNHLMNFRFNQELINKKNIIHFKGDFTLEEVQAKENIIVPTNVKYSQTHHDNIEFRLHNTLRNVLLTKNLEVIFIDFSDNVRYKLLDTIIDYTAYMCSLNKLNFFIRLPNPVTNELMILRPIDAFKLFMVCLYLVNDTTLTNIPNYTIKRVYKQTLPTNTELESIRFKPSRTYDKLFNTIRHHIPPYRVKNSSEELKTFIDKIYLLNIGKWLVLTNLSEKSHHGQLFSSFDFFTQSSTLELGNENIDTFIFNNNLTGLRNLNKAQLGNTIYNILDSFFNNSLSKYFSNRNIVSILSYVFDNFKSYSTQLLNNYTHNQYLITNMNDSRYDVTKDTIYKIYVYNSYNLNIDSSYKLKKTHTLHTPLYIDSTYRYSVQRTLSSTVDIKIKNVGRNIFSLVYPIAKVLFNLSKIEWMKEDVPQDRLAFLASVQ